MGNKTEFETRNGREIGNETELETRNGRKWETRRDKIHNFSTKNKKNRGKNLKIRGKNTIKTGEKTGKKTENYNLYRKAIFMRFQEILKTETSFQHDFGKC